MSVLVAKKLEIMNTNRWRLHAGDKSIEIREQIDRIVKVVLVAKDFVSAAASVDPVHVALPWAGVCFLLSLLVNDSAQRRDAINGLEEISRLVRRYTEIEHIYFQGGATPLLKDLESTVINLYGQVLEYEARAVCQFNRNAAFQFTRNLVKVDSWKDSLSNIRISEANCDKILQVIDSKDQHRRLDEQGRRVNKLLQVSRVQDGEYQKRYLAELQASREEQKDWRHEQRDWNMSEEQSKCFESLRTTPYEHNKERNKNAVEGTCKWFLEHPRYQEWLKRQTSTWLWVTADPGCGKSVLSKTLLNNYERERPKERQNICYFFFKDDSEENKSATHALCALLHQLFTQNTSLLRYAIPYFKMNGEKLPQLFDTLWDIFTLATADPDASSTICVFDALDECAELSRLPLVKKLADYYSNRNTFSQLKFLITSRPNTTIENEIARRSELDLASIQLMGESESEMKAIGIEIGLVIKAKVEEFRLLRSRRNIHDEAHVAIQNKLLDIDNRTYLWVALIFPELEKNAGLHKRKLLKLIETIPSTVDDAYEKILAQSPDVAQAKKLLQIVVAAVRPLTVTELNIALSIHDSHKSLDECELEAEHSFRDTVRKLCGLFIIIQDSKVYLIHQTAKEFLLFDETAQQVTIDTKSYLNSWKHALRSSESHLILARSCVSYLLFPVCESHFLVIPDMPDFAQMKRAVADYISKHDFLEYAATHWIFHFQEAKNQQDESVIRSAVELCNTKSGRFYVWLLFRNWFRLLRRIYGSGDISKDYSANPLELLVKTCSDLNSVVKQLRRCKDLNTAFTDERSVTALWWAIRFEEFEIVKLLLAHKHVNPSFVAENYENPLILAIYHEHGNINLKINGEYCKTPLNLAIHLERIDVVKLLLEHKNIDPNMRTYNGHTPLWYAVFEKREGIVELLLGHKDTNPNLEDEFGETPLKLAARKGYLRIVKLLLGHRDVKPNLIAIGDDTPLIWAVKKGVKEIVKSRLKHENTEPNPKSEDGEAPPVSATFEGHTEIIELLLEREDIDPNLEVNGKTPLWWAARIGYMEAMKLLLKNTSILEDRLAINSALREASSTGQQQIVRLFLENGADVAYLEEGERISS